MSAGIATLAPDTEQTVKHYLRGVDLGAATRRVFLGRPSDGVYPFVVVDGQLGGGDHPDGLPVSEPRIQVIVHASGRNACRTIADLVSAHLSAAASAVVTLPTGTAVIDGIVVTGGPMFVPDNTAAAARYVITAVIATRHTAL